MKKALSLLTVVALFFAGLHIVFSAPPLQERLTLAFEEGKLDEAQSLLANEGSSLSKERYALDEGYLLRARGQLNRSTHDWGRSRTSGHCGWPLALAIKLPNFVEAIP